MNIKEFKDLEMACKPIIDYLNENYNPYTSVVITSSEIKLVEDLAGIPVVTQTKMDMTNKKETAPEVPVQEQILQIKKKINSLQWCVTMYFTSILIILIILHC